MIITCPNDNKQFELDANLIPVEGRLLQCGFCGHKWHYSLPKDTAFLKNNISDIEENIETIKISEDINNDKEKTRNKVEKKYQREIFDDTVNNKENSTKLKRINYFNLLLVLIISFIAIILIMDTFKVYFSRIFPDLNMILNNLYETLKDIKLFFNDLL